MVLQIRCQPPVNKICYLVFVNVYILSGMGADHRAFSFITLPKGFEAIHIPWIKPDKKEPLAAYALRLAGAIRTSEPFILVGLSMGGGVKDIFQMHRQIMYI